jgi:hypothetical protein
VPEFFVRFLTNSGDTVLDIFAGSNTTGEVAEALDRKWLSCECNRDYVTSSAFRFMSEWTDDDVADFVDSMGGDMSAAIEVLPRQPLLF